MPNQARWTRGILATSAVGAAAAVVWFWFGSAPAPPETPPPPVAEATPSPAPPPEPIAEPEAELRPPLALPPEDAPPSFASIDLEAARAALPDNLYWEHFAPTDDPRLLGDRERAKTEWNEQYGKVVSGTATEEEIHAFFDRRMHVSSDSVRFVDWVIENQGDDLSDQDLELLHVAKRLHLARLEEVPRRLQEALDRKVQQDAAREEWLAEQRAFEEGAEGTPADDGMETPTPDDVP